MFVITIINSVAIITIICRVQIVHGQIPSQPVIRSNICRRLKIKHPSKR